MRNLIHLLLVTLLLATVQATFADKPEMRPRPFSVHDLDRDGYLDRREYDAMRQRRLQRLGGMDGRGWRHHRQLLDFDRIDGDGNGRISVEELGSALGSGRRLQRRFRQGSDCAQQPW